MQLKYNMPLSKGQKLCALLALAIVTVITSFFMTSTALADTLVYAKGNPTYIRPAKNSNSYNLRVEQGYQFYVQENDYSEWYRATKDTRGNNFSGYVHRSEVETSIGGSNSVKTSLVTKDTYVKYYPFDDAPNGAVLKQGTFIRYSMYNSEWAWAKFDGFTGFFRVTNLSAFNNSNAQAMTGAIASSSLEIKTLPQSGAKTMRSLSAGTLIRFVEFDSNYLTAQFDGKVGYFEKSKIALHKPLKSGNFLMQVGSGGTKALSAPNKNSEVLLTVPAGAQSYLADFNGEYYMATVKSGNGTRLAFFDANDFVMPDQKPGEGSSWVIAARPSAPIYDSVNGSRIATVSKGAMFDTVSLGSGWYSTVISIGGNARTVYVSQKDFRPMSGSITVVKHTTNYNISLSDAVRNQLGKQNGNNYFAGNSFVSAPESTVRYYMDPNNFPEGSTSYLQFLRLDKSAGIAPGAMNAQLKNMGVLAGQGQAFREASDRYKINELYLMSHAIHETGRGTSNLAKGVYFDPITNMVSYDYFPGAVKVYNVYGIGAVDNNPLQGGAKKAYEEGWTSVSKAVVGGAKFVAYNYIDSRDVTMSGQNTLYKMLWHPEYNAAKNTAPWHQYATDIGWANTQTYYLAALYADYEAYTMTFDVPSYNGN